MVTHVNGKIINPIVLESSIKQGFPLTCPLQCYCCIYYGPFIAGCWDSRADQRMFATPPRGQEVLNVHFADYSGKVNFKHS